MKLGWKIAAGSVALAGGSWCTYAIASRGVSVDVADEFDFNEPALEGIQPTQEHDDKNLEVTPEPLKLVNDAPRYSTVAFRNPSRSIPTLRRIRPTRENIEELNRKMTAVVSWSDSVEDICLSMYWEDLFEDHEEQRKNEFEANCRANFL